MNYVFKGRKKVMRNLEHEFVHYVIHLQNGDFKLKWYVTNTQGHNFPSEAVIGDIIGGIDLREVPKKNNWGHVIGKKLVPNYKASSPYLLIHQKNLFDEDL